MTDPVHSWQTTPAGELVAWIEDREAASSGLCRHDCRLVAERRLRELLTETGVDLATVQIRTRYAPDFCRTEAFVPAELWRGSSARLARDGELVPVEALVLVPGGSG